MIKPQFHLLYGCVLIEFSHTIVGEVKKTYMELVCMLLYMMTKIREKLPLGTCIEDLSLFQIEYQNFVGTCPKSDMICRTRVSKAY